MRQIITVSFDNTIFQLDEHSCAPQIITPDVDLSPGGSRRPR
jgi:hypothetical protein